MPRVQTQDIAYMQHERRSRNCPTFDSIRHLNSAALKSVWGADNRSCHPKRVFLVKLEGQRGWVGVEGYVSFIWHPIPCRPAYTHANIHTIGPVPILSHPLPGFYPFPIISPASGDLHFVHLTRLMMETKLDKLPDKVTAKAWTICQITLVNLFGFIQADIASHSFSHARPTLRVQTDRCHETMPRKTVQSVTPLYNVLLVINYLSP